MVHISSSAALWFLPFAVIISIWVAWSDMKFMKIPNKAVIALLIVFVVIGVVALPFDVWAWRWLHVAVVLAIGFVANAVGLLGAGDAKFAAAIAPFVPLADVSTILYLFAAVLLGAFATHRLFRAIPAWRAFTADWQSWEHKDFPMGLALGGTLSFYLVIGAIYGP